MIAPHYAGDVVADINRTLEQGIHVSVSGLDTDFMR